LEIGFYAGFSGHYFNIPPFCADLSALWRADAPKNWRICAPPQGSPLDWRRVVDQLRLSIVSKYMAETFFYNPIPIFHNSTYFVTAQRCKRVLLILYEDHEESGVEYFCNNETSMMFLLPRRGSIIVTANLPTHTKSS
jgi:hypothetical protein